MLNPTPTTIYLKDYTPPPFLISTVDLDVDIRDDEALVKANPDQIIWGSDWPHPRLEKDMPEDGHLLDLFNAWTPEPLRKKILVDNPAKLYGFN